MAKIRFKWKYVLPLALAVFTGQVKPPPPQPVLPEPVLPGLITDTNNNNVRIINNGNGTIIITGGGQLIIGGQIIGGQGVPPTALMPTIDENWDLPIVSTGFASDKAIDGPIVPLVQALRAEQYETRENATQTLLRMPADRLDDVTAALATETDAEAITRLKEVAGYLFLKARTPVKTPSRLFGIGVTGEYSAALIGIPIGGDVLDERSDFFVPVRVPANGSRVELANDANEQKGELRMTLRVQEIQPGFPAAQALQIGDLIEAINGTPLPLELNATRFVERVKGLWPGNVVTFTVVRGGQLVDVPVQTVVVPSDLRDSADRLGVWIRSRRELRDRFVERLKTGVKPRTAAKDAGPKAKDESALR